MQDQEASANVGRAGEYLALSRLSLAGHFCTLAQFQDHDAYIQTDTRILTLQIKTASRRVWRRYPFYTKQGASRKRSDVYAFVAMDVGKILWVRGDDPVIRPASTHIPINRFKENDEKVNMQKVLASFA